MAKETVEAVRQAELNAVKLEREATLKKDAILQKANEDGKALILARTKEAMNKASLELKNIEIQGEKLMEEAVRKSEQEIEMLKELAKSKEQIAISRVLQEVI